MKSKTKLPSLLLFFVIAALSALAVLFWRGENISHTEGVSDRFYFAAGDKVVIMDNGASEFVDIIYDASAYTGAAGDAVALEKFFYKYSEEIYARKESSTTPTTKVVTFGRIDNVPLSVRLADEIEALPEDSYAWGIAYENGVLAIYANAKYAVTSPVSRTLSGHDLFKDLYAALDELISDGKVIVTEGQFEVYSVSAEEYAALLAEDDAQYIRETEERRALRVEFIKNELADRTLEDFGTPETGYTLTTDFGKALSGSPDYYPTADAHPRVLFTAEDIPAIREKLEGLDKYGALSRQIWGYLNDEEIDGILGEPRKQSRGFHNYDWEMLYAIQAYALAYAVYDVEYYGYVAIYAMENFLLTLQVDYIFSDQCREFGYAMYIAACVYDWCYDLLTEADKMNIAMGVEHRLCRGEVPNTHNGILSTSYPVKMEMGFPPTGQGAVGGHGSEFQLLRDYLAMSIAVYDELPGWYELVGGRFYNEFAVVRRDYYAAGMYPQGMSYGPYRFLPDTYAAVLIQTATGKSAYGSEIADVIYTFLANETVGGGLFSTGDCGLTALPATSIGSEALILSYVLSETDDASLLLGIAEYYMTDKAYIEASLESVSLAEYLIFTSRDAEGVVEYRSELPLIWYNGGYMGQYIARNSWGDDAAVVMMRVGQITTGNHDHKDAGTFQIYYKGLISGSSGGSGTYGSNHWSYYYQATVSDNGLLIFDASLASTEADIKKDANGEPLLDRFGNVSYNNSEKLFYTGSQIRPSSDPGSYAEWLSGRYDRAKLLGYAEGYSQSGEAQFAYVASDITKSYLPTQASYVGRSMLTVYTGDENYPMIFFVFDNIDVAKDELVKKFLLQINGKNAPEIDESTKTVIVEENGGQLVLQNVLGAEKIEKIGGGYGSNFVINGTNCLDASIEKEHASQQSWGRVEISSAGADSSDLMLNVIYVSDSGNGSLLRASGVKGYDKMTDDVLLEGATIGNVTALFSTEYDRTADEIYFTSEGEGLMSYYIGGLFEGTWVVSINGTKAGTVYSTKNSGLVSFKAPAGAAITLTPGADIRPAGSEKITFITNGGSVVGDVPSFYFPGTETPLPTEAVRGADYFDGWYLDKEFTQPVSAIPKDASGTVILYAKWNSVFVTENFSNVKIEILDKPSGSAYQNGIGYLVTDNVVTTYKVDGEGEKYLFWQTAGGGPTVYMDGATSTIATMSGNKITYVFSFADAGTEKDMGVSVRVRNTATPKATVNLFNISGGKVVFNDTKIAALSESEFTTVTVVLDFELGEIRAKTSASSEVFSMSVSLPERETFAREIFAMRSSGEGAIKVGLIKIIEGDVLGDSSEPASKDYFDFPKEAVFPLGTDKTYVPDEKTPIPSEGVTAVIEGVRHELVGWYLDEALTQPVSTVPDGVSGKLTLYAKWRVIIVTEDYSETTLNEVEKTSVYQDKGGIIYLETGGKTTTFKTEDEYLLWESDGAGSSVYMDAKSLSIATMSSDEITYIISLAKGKGESDMNLEVRVRNAATVKETVSLFNLVGGKVVFDGKEIAELGEEFITVKVVVDFARGEIRACTSASDEGYAKIAALPARESFSKELFAIRASSAGSVRIGDIKLVEGDALNMEIASPTERDYISFPPEAKIPDGTDASYTPDAKTPIPTEGVYAVIDGKRQELVGWYLDEALTTPISTVPDGVSGKFSVYAKWRTVIVTEDYSETTLDFVDVTSLYYTNEATGIKYYQTDGKKTTYKTEDGELGKHLFWQQSEGSGAQILIESSAIADMSSEQISYSFSFADAGGEVDMNITVSVRNANKDETRLFEISGGKVKFDGRELATLTEDGFTTVKLVLDFEKSEVRLMISGSDEIYTASVSLDVRANYTREVFRMRSGNAGSIRIGEIKAYADDILNG